MREALVFAGLVIGAVGAVFSAAEMVPAPSAGTVAPAAAKRVPPAPPRVSVSSVRNELRRAGDGHFYAGVSANGRAVTMLVDTGASVVALTGEDARAIGLFWSPGDLRVVATGAGGPISGVPVKLDRLALGGHEAEGVPAVIIPEGLPVSLLGQSFLSTVDPLRIEGDRMILGE